MSFIPPTFGAAPFRLLPLKFDKAISASCYTTEVAEISVDDDFRFRTKEWRSRKLSKQSPYTRPCCVPINDPTDSPFQSDPCMEHIVARRKKQLEILNILVHIRSRIAPGRKGNTLNVAKINELLRTKKGEALRNSLPDFFSKVLDTDLTLLSASNIPDINWDYLGGTIASFEDDVFVASNKRLDHFQVHAKTALGSPKKSFPMVRTIYQVDLARPDSQQMFLLTRQKDKVRLVNASKWKDVLKVSHLNQLRFVALHPQVPGEFAFVAEKELRFHQLDSNVRSIPASEVRSCLFVHHPRLILTAADRAVRLWDLRSRESVAEMDPAVGLLKETLMCLQRAPQRDYMFFSASTRYLFCMDLRWPQSPVHRWSHLLRTAPAYSSSIFHPELGVSQLFLASQESREMVVVEMEGALGEALPWRIAAPPIADHGPVVEKRFSSPCVGIAASKSSDGFKLFWENSMADVFCSSYGFTAISDGGVGIEVWHEWADRLRGAVKVGTVKDVDVLLDFLNREAVPDASIWAKAKAALEQNDFPRSEATCAHDVSSFTPLTKQHVDDPHSQSILDIFFQGKPPKGIRDEGS